MEILLLIVFLVLTVPVVMMSPMAFMATDSGVSAKAYTFILVVFSLTGVYVYGMYKLYRFLQPYAEAIPNVYLWLLVPTVLVWSWLRGKR